uniref:Kisspeptin 2 n=1 Tax=Seriola lalandi dorsalis TaxID=1841481 RepID=A0A3B4X6B2_SERLL
FHKTLHRLLISSWNCGKSLFVGVLLMSVLSPGSGSGSGSGSVLSVLSRRTAADFLDQDPNLCFSLRENDDQRQLLCNDRRSKFNFNPFGLRFGKRYNGYIYRRAVQRARTNKFSPLS